jgi:Tfp pilus assembly protein PilF
LTRASYLRELHGKLDGALELMEMAYDRVPLSETEDRAWLLTQTAHLELLMGNLSKAETYANQALTAFPDYDLALAALAQVRIAQVRYAEAATLLRKRYDAAPHAETLYSLAEAEELSGRHEEAAESFRDFERQAVALSTASDNVNRELIFYYLDHAGQPAKALEIAKREASLRQDVFTLDSYAWALAGNGDYTAAKAQLQKPLAMGVKDPEILFHAGSIALHLHQSEQAELYLKDAASRFSHDAANLIQEMHRFDREGPGFLY